MKYSVFHKIENRYKFFEKFCRRNFKKIKDSNLRDNLIESCEELMEVIVKMLLDHDCEAVKDILLKKNSKYARTFFDYFVSSETRHMKKKEMINAIDEYFKKENEMKDIHDFLVERVKPVTLKNNYVPFKLNEAEGDEDGGGDEIGGDDPFADEDANGGDPFSDNDGDENDSNNSDDEENDTEDNEETEEDIYDIKGHKDDPDFTKGGESGEVVQPTPAGKCIYDVEAVMRSLNSVINALKPDELAEFEAVKKAVTLIFNGKLLNPEDVTFNNPKNAAFLIKKIAAGVNGKTRNYLILKIKQPLIKQRDAFKEDNVNIENSINNLRKTIDSIEK